ncbi:MAG: sulfite exporter TauE/SafE family protein [Magnetococcales bacterium]|nr:sulfite exporter TauE/SafE family protein [Magnetococcales bacterium]
MMEWIIATSAVTLGAALQGALGFGAAVVAIPILALLNPALVPGPMMLAAFFLTALTWHRERHAVVFADVQWAFLGRLGGIGIGAWTLTMLSGGWMELTLGVIVIVATLPGIRGIHLHPTTPNLIWAGAVSGFMGTTASLGGPAMALVYQNVSGPRLRGSLAAYFTLGILITLPVLWGVDRFGPGEIRAGLILTPGIIVGFILSKRFTPYVDRGRTKPAVLLLSGTAGLLLVLRAILHISAGG